MASGIIKTNKMKCLICGDILLSKDPTKFEKCSCGNLQISGGNSFSAYKIKNNNEKQVKDMRVLNDLPFTPNDNIQVAPPKG